MGGELRHHAVLLRTLHLPVDETNLVAEALPQLFKPFRRVGEMLGTFGFGFLHQRADPVDQLAGLQRAADAIRHLVEAAHRNGAGIDRLATGRFFAQLGDVHVAKVCEHQRARDRRRAQHQHIDRFALVGQREPFAYAEAMLFVDHGQRQRLEDHVVLDQRMRSDQKIDLAGFQLA